MNTFWINKQLYLIFFLLPSFYCTMTDALVAFLLQKVFVCFYFQASSPCFVPFTQVQWYSNWRFFIISFPQGKSCLTLDL